MTVKQQAERLDVQVKLSGPDGDRTVSDSYVINGKEADFTPPLVGGGGTAKNAKRTATWSPDGKDDNVQGRRSWRLSDDGKTLTIEMEITQPDGGVMKSKRSLRSADR